MFFVTDSLVMFYSNASCGGVFICPLWDWSNFLSPFYADLLGWDHRRGIMNGLHAKHQNASFGRASASYTDASTSLSTTLPSVHRLIVLIPANIDYSATTRRIWELANAIGARILFLSLCRDIAQEPSLRRELVMISALFQNGRVFAEAKVEVGTNWVDAVKRNYQVGDMVVCFAEQRAGLLHRPLSQILEANLNVPIYILSSLSTQNISQSNWLSQLLAWLGSIGILVGFSLLQIRITLLPQDWAQTTLLILSVMGEVWSIWGWNSLFN